MNVVKLAVPFSGGVVVGSVIMATVFVKMIDHNPDMHEAFVEGASTWLYKKVYGQEPQEPRTRGNRYVTYNQYERRSSVDHKGPARTSEKKTKKEKK
jgi:hypothetical protein